MDKNLAINLVRVTEMAAIESAKYLGKGDKNGADAAAVAAMRKMFSSVDVDGSVVIGEGEMDEAPMLYIGERVGMGEGYLKVDIAVDPVDGTTSVAKGFNNAVAIVAMAPAGTLLHAPDMYMDKIAVGPKLKGKVNLSMSVEEILHIASRELGKPLTELTITMLDRDRHNKIVKVCRRLGCRIKMVMDGDVAAAIDTCFEDTGIDLMLGSGGAPEGVLAAAAIKCLGGDFQGKLIVTEPGELRRCEEMGVDPNVLYRLDDLVRSDEVYFAMTGISESNLLRGVKFKSDDIVVTHSVVMRAETGTIRMVEARHNLTKKKKVLG
ncbi:MAG: class II fructose-bisphosphatase [Peptostreptococcaceae bacterium]|nr:class II fructose-bisphosphatase [Peptostreptococcaceae bacterium]